MDEYFWENLVDLRHSNDAIIASRTAGVMASPVIVAIISWTSYGIDS